MEHEFIYKVLRTNEHLQFQEDKIFKGSPVDLKDGFIHLSSKNQVSGVISRYYNNESKVYVYKFRSSDYQKNLKWEYSERSKEHYPHIYNDSLLLKNLVEVEEINI